MGVAALGKLKVPSCMAFLNGLKFRNDLLDAVGAEADVDAAGADDDLPDQQLGDPPLFLGQRVLGEMDQECGFVYRVGSNDYRSEWVCPEHSGYARGKFEAWWRARSNEPCPATAEHAVALAEAGAPAPTEAITVRSVSGSGHSTVSAMSPCYRDVTGCHRLAPVPFVSVWRFETPFSLRQTTQLATSIPNAYRTFRVLSCPAKSLHSTRGRDAYRFPVSLSRGTEERRGRHPPRPSATSVVSQFQGLVCPYSAIPCR